MTGLYIHIPFCRSKCYYCDFYSLAGNTELLGSYVDALLKEVQIHSGMAFDTLYIGGGTPSLLDVAGLEKLAEGLHQHFDLSGLREATIEANPESACPAFMQAALKCGFNRLSLGAQSLNDGELAKAGRIHTSAQALEAVKTAIKSGFSNVSTDVIIGLPGQTEVSLEDTINRLAESGVSHLSAYCLSVEEGTPFACRPPRDLPDDDRQADLYTKACGLLKGHGFIHYEISNFALPGKESLHNLNYWKGGEYLGLGPFSASYLDGRRVKNIATLQEYLDNPLSCRLEEDSVSATARPAEEAMLRLRLLEEGLDLRLLERKYGMDNVCGLETRLEELAVRKLLVRQDNSYRLASDAVLIANQAFAQVIE